MATNDQVAEAKSDAMLALLNAAKNAAGGNPKSALMYAEAYAWLDEPAQTHGGGSATETPI